MSGCRALAGVALLVSVAFAGCIGGEPGEDPASTHAVDRDSFQLQVGRGAIAGLLVDDRFRPIHLVDDPQGEFQTTGFVLLQETGQQVQTTENGEFSFTDVEPGAYTLRVTAAGHEAIPQRVGVEEGLFSEINVVARRVISQGSLILTQEYTIFKPCEFTLVAIGLPFDCTFDQSGETARDAFSTDYSAFPEATWLVTEFQANQAGYYEVRVGEAVGSSTGNYAIEEVVDGDYTKIIIERDGEPTQNLYGATNRVWTNEGPFTTILYVDGMGKEEGLGFGVGVFVAIEGKFLQSVFLGEPEVDLDAYCVLC